MASSLGSIARLYANVGTKPKIARRPAMSSLQRRTSRRDQSKVICPGKTSAPRDGSFTRSVYHATCVSRPLMWQLRPAPV